MKEFEQPLERGPKKRILVADDDEVIIAGVEATLEMLDYEVVIVHNGKELLAKLESGVKFNAVITDNNMPEMDGIDALEQIRKNPKFEKLPVILHTGGGDPNLEGRVRKLGARYLEKPYGFETLESILGEALKENK